MKLKKCLEITKTTKFEVFVYTNGYTKEKRGLDEAPIAIFDVARNERGKIQVTEELKKYENSKVQEIIPCMSQVNIVVEV